MYTPLVRKYAIQHFDDVIGQPIVVKILKNSLFLNHIFSVYLFAGKHGCGKTSTARLFSTALNCERLTSFQKNPHEKLPCQSCKSCTAMQLMQHPDFIEIDAASHTGVDNVRLLIESATLLPLIGNKKIYLIDEAHMLSKAACNAFLKILEEPPKNVLFILATTAPEKILETVRSRCFQLFFNPVNENIQTDHLCSIANKEHIVHTREGVARIVRMSKGSVRDGVNMLDQTRLAVSNISVESFEQVFGSVSDDNIIHLFEHIFLDRQEDSFLLFQKIIPRDHAAFTVVFDRIIHCARTLLWFLYGNHITDDINTAHFNHLSNVTPGVVIQFLSHMCQQEAALKRSENPAVFFEMILLVFMEKNESIQNHNSLKAVIAEKQNTQIMDSNASANNTTVFDTQKQLAAPTSNPEEQNGDARWSDFLQKITHKDDPLLLSIFKQGTFQSFDPVTHTVTLLYQKDRSFFADVLTEHKKDWLPTLQVVFGSRATLHTVFTTEITKEPIITVTQTRPEQSPLNSKGETPVQHRATQKEMLYKQTTPTTSTKRGTFINRTSKIDISDRNKWHYANLLQSVFPGTITEIEKGDL